MSAFSLKHCTTLKLVVKTLWTLGEGKGRGQKAKVARAGPLFQSSPSFCQLPLAARGLRRTSLVSSLTSSGTYYPGLHGVRLELGRAGGASLRGYREKSS